jgi:His/Glu/Gln/Arg/opine family amino acid ABC transporter permease subunit
MRDLLPEWFEPIAELMLREGLPLTLKLAGLAVTASLVVGLLLGTLITIKFPPLQALIRFYIEVWRGLPILVTVLFIYWIATADVGGSRIELSAFMSGAVGLSLWGSAQVAEATRGAVQSIPREQHEAAAALGFGWIGRHRHVIVPQALRRLLPPTVGLLVNVIQNTTIVALIGGGEILEIGSRQFENVTFGLTGTTTAPDYAPFMIFGFVLLLFFVISFPLTLLARYLERRLV